MSKIAILVPVLGRRHHVRRVMANVKATTNAAHRLLFIASPNEHEEIAELRAAGADFVVFDCDPAPGDYAAKINHGYRLTTEPYIFTAADDLLFYDGWDAAALRRFEAPGIGVVGTNDMGNYRVMAGEHSTHSLVSRAYADTQGTIDGPGAILSEAYPHEFCDDELVATARMRAAMAFAPDSMVEHLHPHWGKAPTDASYDESGKRLLVGREVFRTRRQSWGRVRKDTPAISVIVGTFGDDRWRELALERAVPSALDQRTPAAEVIHVHGATLADARNEGAHRARSPWLCFLDADDELDPSFIARMSAVARGDRDLLTPAVQVVAERTRSARHIPERDLREGNYLVIGTVVRAGLFWAAGGFDSQWEAWEDWALWMRVRALGGTVECVSTVYRAHASTDGRNSSVRDPDGLRRRILADFDAWNNARTSVQTVNA